MLYQQFRCLSCKKLLFKGVLVDSEVEVKCRGCGEMNTFHGLSKDRLLCFVDPCPQRVSRREALDAKDADAKGVVA